MELRSLKKIINAFVYGIFSIILAIILIRILLKLLGANPEAEFVIFWYDLSSIFVAMFRGIYPSIQPESSQIIVETYSIIAMIFYLLAALLTSKTFTSVATPNGIQIIKNIVDALFKIVEFLLITRFILRLTGASVSSTFVSFIYNISALVYEPFAGIFPTIKVENYDIIFESSTLIAIVVIIIFDLITEGIIDNLREALSDKSSAVRPGQQVVHAPAGAQPTQHITINIPQPQAPQPQPTNIIDRRTVQVFPQGTYPGHGQAHLEGQRPQRTRVLTGQISSTPIHGQNAARPNQPKH